MSAHKLVRYGRGCGTYFGPQLDEEGRKERKKEMDKAWRSKNQDKIKASHERYQNYKKESQK